MVPVVNENDTVATTEIRFGDNDRLAALVAHLVHADVLVLLSDVDGLYDGPPSRAGSTLVEDVADVSRLDGVVVGRAGSSGVGTGGMQTKLEAARIATGAGIPVVLTSADHAAEALAGRSVGTLFHATGRRRPTRQLWLAHATEAKGAIQLDEGAVRALTERQGVVAACRHHRRLRHVRRRRPGRPAGSRRDDGRAGARELRRGGAADAPGTVHPRPRPRARRGVRARGRAPRRPGRPRPLNA